MALSTIQFIVFAAIAAVVLAGVLFIIQDARAQRREQERFSNRRKNANPTRTFHREHEPA